MKARGRPNGSGPLERFAGQGEAPGPLYVKVKRHVLDQIEGGRVGPNDRLPSESELMALTGVSRMTVNRALRELADAGVLTRIQGVGTFVAEPKPHPGLVEIVDIAEEIRARGRRHSARVISLKAIRAPVRIAAAMQLDAGERLFHSIIVHSDDNVPIQLEERWVNPAIGPDYLDQDFTRTTPFQYLQSVKGFTEAEHMIAAVMPTARVQELLHLSANEPCLRLTRRTWVYGTSGTYNLLTYPGSRYVLGTRIRGS